MKVRFPGAHNLESRDTRVACVVIDGVLAIDAGGLTSSLTLDEQLQLNAICITHHHYDHLRDIPMIALAFELRGQHLRVYSTNPVRDALRYLFTYPEGLYINALERPRANPTLQFTVVEALAPFRIGDYEVVAVPVNHSVPAVGYQVTAPDGKRLFYTGDTGAGLGECWQHVTPDLLVIECTGSDRLTENAQRAKHLSPKLLREELLAFRKLHSYLPRVITTHMLPGPQEEAERRRELERLAAELGTPIIPAHEGMEVEV